eukprot:GILJ01002918.1.p1 GENE.GILJ01002918.1~~GILJ01002918.1.p1  ORF type:complete len:485 (-),score=76.04 GILJ01002918.1:130-1584(-)
MVRVADTGWRRVSLLLCAHLLLSSCMVSAVRQDLFSQFQPSSLGVAAKPSALPITTTQSQQKLQEQGHQWRFVQSKDTKSWRMTPMSPSTSPQATPSTPVLSPLTPSLSASATAAATGASSVSSLLSQFIRNKDGSSPPLMPATPITTTSAIPSLLSSVPTSFTLADGSKDSMLDELQKTVGTLTDVVSNDWRHPGEKSFVGASDAAGVLTDIRNFDPMTSTQLLPTSVPLLTTPLLGTTDPQASFSSFLELAAANPMLAMAGPAAGMAMGGAAPPIPGAAAAAPGAAKPGAPAGAAPAGTAAGTAADGSGSSGSGSSANGPSNGAPPSSWWLPPAPAMPVMPYMGLMHYPYPAMSPMSPTLGGGMPGMPGMPGMSGMSMPMGAPYMPAPPPGYVPPYPGYARPPFAYAGMGYPGPAAYAPYGSPPAFPYTPPPSVQTSVATPFPTAGALGYPPVTISVHYPGYYSFKEKQSPRLHPGDSVPFV